tara:strand:+ start:503 stop:937 length:435 start_codon:yes stop_codon:yes gene_type:complete
MGSQSLDTDIHALEALQGQGQGQGDSSSSSRSSPLVESTSASSGASGASTQDTEIEGIDTEGGLQLLSKLGVNHPSSTSTNESNESLMTDDVVIVRLIDTTYTSKTYRTSKAYKQQLRFAEATLFSSLIFSFVLVLAVFSRSEA